MTETRQKLETINSSDFENLVLHYLASIHADFTSIIQTGINEDGKPIKGKLDAVKYLPGNPSQCIGVASTVTALKGLKRKWLTDINSAYEEFNEYKKIDPQLVCKLYLATNRHLPSQTALYREIHTAAQSRNILVDIIEGSGLIRFLDSNIDGQFIRQKIFHINAERLGTDLLRQIGQESLTSHRNKFGLSTGIQNPEITRIAQLKIVDTLATSNKRLFGIRGGSGTGKSTVVRQTGEYLHSLGRIVIWIPAENIERVWKLRRSETF